MLVVVASRHDGTARALAARWAAHDAVVLTPADLSLAGWSYRAGAPRSSTAVLGGRVVHVDEIRGVLTRMRYVGEHEVSHILPADRAYVAAEMAAFLRAWLSILPCPVLNRPAGSCLAGVSWRAEQWAAAAARLGLPALSQRRRARFPPRTVSRPAEMHIVSVIVVAGQCFGDVDEAVARASRCLAASAGVGLLAVHWSTAGEAPSFMAADPVPDVSDPDVEEAVLSYLTSGRRC